MTSGIEMTNVSKRFGGLQALDSVDFTAAAGEVHALLGQNGSGKSTLVKIMTGVHAPDAGAKMEVWGTPVDLPLTAPHEHGIAVIHQDLGLVEHMTVLENIGISSSFGTSSLGRISFGRERAKCTELLAALGLSISPDTFVADLSPAEQATVAIARASRILEEHSERVAFVLDEPTAYLSAEESARVVRLMRTVADRGSAVIFISHRLGEVIDVADRITVLRDGQVADTFRSDEGDHGRILDAMLGRRLSQSYPDKPARTDAAPTLVVTGLNGRRLGGLSFSASPGEIVGFAGLVGMGHEEIPYLLARADRPAAGRIVFDGVDLADRTAAQAIDLGVSLVPGNRKRDGIWPEASGRENLALLGDRRRPALAPLRIGAERSRARTAMARFGVNPPEPERRVDQFSGGNQQKIVLAKWMAHDPLMLLLDEPTQGIDAGAKFDVLEMIGAAAAGGAIVLIASGDYEQLAHICHRVLVVRFGRVVAELVGDEITEATIARVAQADEAPAA
jgi:ribose transport system ATP-binding protein